MRNDDVTLRRPLIAAPLCFILTCVFVSVLENYYLAWISLTVVWILAKVFCVDQERTVFYGNRRA